MNKAVTDLQTLREQIAALPERLQVMGEPSETETTKAEGPFAVIARQGRLILRLTAAVEATEARLKTLEQVPNAVQEAQSQTIRAEEETRKVLREAALPLMDALDFAAEVARSREDPRLAESIVGAQRDGLRRLAALGIAQIPAQVGTSFDGRLHEAVEARDAPYGVTLPQYAILSIVRAGYQQGSYILRRTMVITVR